MTDSHADLGADLSQLANQLLDKLEPIVTTAALLTEGAEPSPCQEQWCPVCALAALVHDQDHPLLQLIAEHSVTLMSAVRMAVAQRSPKPAPPSPPPPDNPAGPPPREPDPEPAVEPAPEPAAAEVSAAVRYHRIPVTVQP
ncbi:hypothetical protein [Mycolicibacterium brumae]|uniref:hypothetical protein n=1 Tax=Mycolicibacterium brumae TaxID=85968 RepID=UPI000A9C3897|nr:hypothetical protein [Mycolicibacterium brumae]MCV7194202.1 hypothetical protein [Mycolicibacterium brumae]RWA19439.1 hypothetical protein MBRU_16940 [Mycolicibacterium brumae DSM 44177]UWW08369.1 hypothetical protein L2Z93_001423 [Mycolicibacterium brumae]